MTNEQAITKLQQYLDSNLIEDLTGNEGVDEAIRMGVDALKQLEIVYCKDCQLRCEDYYTKNIHGTVLYYCSQLAQMIEADFYCGYAERKKE